MINGELVKCSNLKTLTVDPSGVISKISYIDFLLFLFLSKLRQQSLSELYVFDNSEQHAATERLKCTGCSETQTQNDWLLLNALGMIKAGKLNQSQTGLEKADMLTLTGEDIHCRIIEQSDCLLRGVRGICYTKPSCHARLRYISLLA